MGTVLQARPAAPSPHHRFPEETTRSTLFRPRPRRLILTRAMICDHIDASARYAGLGARFAAAFQYLQRARRGEFALGRTEIVPDDVWASTVRKPGRPAAAAGFEYHARFADVHLCLDGCERLGWCEQADGLAVRKPFNAEEDFGLYEGTPEEFLALSGGRFAVFFPGELHAPLIADGELTKICVKVRCDAP